MYDVAVIGAGVNGCAISYELGLKEKKVILFDEGGIASGGSGAAGAFISPKFTKSGELKELLHTAFVYSLEFYEEHFPKLLTKSPLLHIAKDEVDAEVLKAYKKTTPLKLLDMKDETNESVAIDAGIVNAKVVCQAMAKFAKFINEKVETLVYDDGVWVINETYSAKEIVLATGAYDSLINEPYIKLRGVWGHRIDVKTTTNNPHSIHQEVSISPSRDGKLAIGATHDTEYHPQKTTEPYDIEKGREELLKKASCSIKLKDVEITKDYMGLRSGSYDYIPLLGKVVLCKETLQNKEINFYVKKADFSEYDYYPNLYMINGSGGYGFVLAPYLAKLLCENMLTGKKISERLSPARFFARWAKKL